MPETIVGIIANPAAGKDIRRIVSQGRFISNQEKVNTLTRVMAGLEAVGVQRIVFMPDIAMLGAAASAEATSTIPTHILDFSAFNEDRDSTTAAGMMTEMGVGCLVTLGGDGTNRAVAKGCGNVPLLPISTGTNNVFPALVEGTTAGLAAGVVATGAVDVASVTSIRPMLKVTVDGERRDLALIDVAISRQPYLGARAIWDVGQIEEMFVSGVYSTSIGMASIAASLPVASASGLHVRLGPGGIVVSAPVTPGMFSKVPVAEWSLLPFDEARAVSLTSGTIAVDGERSVVIHLGQHAEVTLVRDGPRVVSIDRALAEAGRAGVFVL